MDFKKREPCSPCAASKSKKYEGVEDSIHFIETMISCFFSCPRLELWTSLRPADFPGCVSRVVQQSTHCTDPGSRPYPGPHSHDVLFMALFFFFFIMRTAEPSCVRRSLQVTTKGRPTTLELSRKVDNLFGRRMREMNPKKEFVTAFRGLYMHCHFSFLIHS